MTAEAYIGSVFNAKRRIETSEAINNPLRVRLSTQSICNHYFTDFGHNFMPLNYTTEDLIKLNNERDIDKVRAMFKKLRAKRMKRYVQDNKVNNKNYRERSTWTP